MKFNVNILFMFLAVLALSFVVIGDQFKEIPMTLTLANQPALIISVELNDNTSSDDDLILRPANSTQMWCSADIYELDGFPDLVSVNATIFDSVLSNLNGVNDNRYHYVNDSCFLEEIVGTPGVNARANCSFDVWFYANYSSWNCSIQVLDTANYVSLGSDNATMNKLIAINSGNDTIDWGLRGVDIDYDADLSVSILNEGNVILDLQIDAYNDTTVGIVSNYSFDCTVGQIPTDVIVFNETVSGIYADSTFLNNDSYIDVAFNAPTTTSGFLPAEQNAFFGINVPSQPTINGTCTGFMRFDGLDANP